MFDACKFFCLLYANFVQIAESRFIAIGEGAAGGQIERNQPFEGCTIKLMLKWYWVAFLTRHRPEIISRGYRSNRNQGADTKWGNSSNCISSFCFSGTRRIS